MLSPLLLSLTLLFEPTLSTPAGYYTLAEMAQTFRKQGVSLTVHPDCANDVYALRFSGLPWPTVAKALVQDERLELKVGDRGENVLQRRPPEVVAEREALAKYLDAARDRIHAVYGKADQKCRELDSLRVDDRQEEVDRLKPPKNAPRPEHARHQLIYLFSGVGNIQFPDISVPAHLTQPKGESTFGRATSGTLLQLPGLFAPNRDLRGFKLAWMNAKEMSDAELTAAARAFGVAMKLTLDPVSLAVTSRYGCTPTFSGKRAFMSGTPIAITPSRFRLEIPREGVFGEEATRLQQARTMAVKSYPPDFGVSERMPARPVRVSEALLRIADGKRLNLVCYVSPFTDSVLRMEAALNVADVLAAANFDRVDPEWTLRVMQERASGAATAGGDKPRTDWPRFSTIYAPGPIVIRNELRFLDGLCASPAAFPTALENARWKGQLPSLAQVSAYVAALDLRRWKDSFFSSNYLHHCNPVSFRPFALALGASDTMKRAMAGVGAKEVVLKLSDLEAPAQRELLRGFRESGPLNDALSKEMLYESCDPMLLAESLAESDPAKLRIQIVKTADRFEFRLTSDGNVLWHSWLTGVADSATS